MPLRSALLGRSDGVECEEEDARRVGRREEAREGELEAEGGKSESRSVLVRLH